MKPNSITINIEEGVQTKAFKPKNVIHRKAFKRIEYLIEKNIKESKYYNSNEFKRVHNTITINGERGAGKTSFMLTVLEWYKNIDNDKTKEIEVLDILDPTLISTKQHVFVLVLAMIEKKVNEKYKEKKCDENYKKWKESLEKLAKGLNQLDGVGTNPYIQDLWDDSALVMAKGLSMAKEGLDLEKKFHIFVNKSLEILNSEKKAFLLFIDDIDTDFSKGWDVLEVLRKYITTPQIITIMAGNFELYEALVRNEKSKLFENLVEFDNKLKSISESNGIYINKENYYKNQIDELTQQYLIKVMSTINRINLHKLYELLRYTNFELEDNNKSLKTFIKETFRNLYGINYPEYFKVITTLPLRTIFQWLYFAKIYKDNNDKERFIDINKDIFSSNFYNFGIDSIFFEILKDNEHSLNEFTFKFINIFSFKDIKEFRPNKINRNYNIALMILPQFLNSNKFLYYKLAFGIKVSLPFYIYDKLKKQTYNLATNPSNDLLYNIEINKYLSIEERIKKVFEAIINLIPHYNNLNINFIKQIYKNKYNINLRIFIEYLSKKNSKKLNLLKKFEEFNEEYKNRLNYSNKNLFVFNEKKLSYDIKGFKKYLESEKERILVNYIDEIIKNDIKTFKDVAKSNNIWNKIPFFNVKNLKGSFIHSYTSPLKIIALFIDILKILETENEENTLSSLINKLLLKYSNQNNWNIILLNYDNKPIENEEAKECNINEYYTEEINDIIKWYKKFEVYIKEFIEIFHIIKSSEFYYTFYEKFESLDYCCITVKEYIRVSLNIYINELVKLYKVDKDKIIFKTKRNIEKLLEKHKNYIFIFKECPIFKAYLNDKEDSLLDNILLVQG